jgi:hypothetical protein
LKLLILVLMLAGCSWGAPTGERIGPVKSLPGGEYIYDFRYSKGCLSDEEIKYCAKTQLINKNLIPVECVNGVEVLSGHGPSNGWVYAKFRCAKAD